MFSCSLGNYYFLHQFLLIIYDFPDTPSSAFSQCQSNLLRQGHWNRLFIYPLNARISNMVDIRSMSYIKNAEYLLNPGSWELCVLILSRYEGWILMCLSIHKHMYVYLHVCVCVCVCIGHTFFNLQECLPERKSLTANLHDADICMLEKIFQQWYYISRFGIMRESFQEHTLKWFILSLCICIFPGSHHRILPYLLLDLVLTLPRTLVLKLWVVTSLWSIHTFTGFDKDWPS